MSGLGFSITFIGVHLVAAICCKVGDYYHKKERDESNNSNTAA